MKITKQDCTCAKGDYTYDGNINTGGEALAVELDGRRLVVEGYIDTGGGSIVTDGDIVTRGGSIYTYGGHVCTHGGHIVADGGVYTGGGEIDTGGGDICTRGGDIFTDGGGIVTRGGDIVTGGGYINTDGGGIVTRGGSIVTHGGELNTDGGHIDTDGGRINGIEPPSVGLQRERIRAVLDAIDAGGKLDMSDWHTCDTTHCVAGWLQHLSDNPSAQGMHPSAAGAALCPEAVAHFHASDDEAMAWMREFVG